MALRITSIFVEKRPILCVTEKNTKKAIPELVRGSVQANIEYLYIRSYGQTASVTSNLWVYSRT